MKERLTFIRLSGVTLLAVVAFVCSCAPSYFVAPGFSGNDLTSGGLAVFPAMVAQGAGQGGAEAYRRACGETVAAELKGRYPSIKVITPSSVAAVLAQGELVNEYSKMTQTFQQTGILDTTTAIKATKVLGVKYFMLVNIQSLYSPRPGNARATISGQVFDSERAEMVFESTVSYEAVSLLGITNYESAINAVSKELSRVIVLFLKQSQGRA